MIKHIYSGFIKYTLSLFLNILSLTIAFSGIITILLYISYQKSFDKHNIHYSTVYQLQIDNEESTLPAVISPILRKNVSDIVAITPVWFNPGIISINKQSKYSFYASSFYANNDIFKIFSFDIINGSAKDALKQPLSIVLTQSLAKKLYENENPIGKQVNLNGHNYTCTAVIKDLPETSSIQTECIVSFETLLQQDNSFAKKWSEWSFRTFLRINSKDNYNHVLKAINSIDEINNVLHEDLAEKSANDSYLSLQALSKLHFTESGQYKTINPIVINILILLAIILAVMGIVNFVNLLTSQAIQRAKVFSIKRILGAGETQLLIQIIVESIIISLIALAIALIIHSYLYPYIEKILQIKGLSFQNRNYWYVYFVLMTIIYSIIASIYPAKYITSVNIIQTVKGTYRFSGKGRFIRNFLLTLQFSFTILLIIASISIKKQINFWHNFDIGIQKENIVYIRTSSNIIKHKDAFVKELLNNPHITEYTYSSFVPGGVGMMWGRTINNQQINIYCWPVDQHFIDFFGIKIKKGRKFSSLKADMNSFIINEKAVEKYHWDKPLEIIMQGFDFEGPIIGVTENFNFSSLKEQIPPMQLWLTDTRPYVLLLKLAGGNTSTVMEHIKNIWGKFEPGLDIDINFLDEHLNNLYQKEEKIAYFIEAVSLWTILLSLTGLLGLTLFTARQRTKEIAVRRVNGATVIEIINLFNREFIKWIILAFLIATPIAYYSIANWIQNFAYKMSISWWIFALSGIFLLIVTTISVSIQTLIIARKNPTESLRYE
ncbi:MAG: ABC transporter permease [Bacteroidales bacterium]|nr:ABC transporter permease [Bacteroidales bacterium]